MATPSYNNDKSADLDYGIDPASGGFFNSDYKKHDDLKQMLDVNKDSMKLEAMKRIIGMMAKGRDASELFPAVVKNVVSKNIEVKKLVYVYLARYAEEQQDLALLSISTFQRALKDPNQLIRASALRVMSSIRVPMIIPIVMLAIKESAVDMSPYVRKTAAHAIPKLYSLDPEQKEELMVVIEKLLQDKTTLVVGSAVMAFEEVCPERIDLIHKNYRKLCNLLVDVDEWGQVIILNMLTRYARTQFTDPNLNEDDSDEDETVNTKPFYEEEVDPATTAASGDTRKKPPTLDPDHRLLLKSAKPLLQSRNTAVVMCVAQLYHHLAPKREVSIIAKALVRMLRASREVQSVVLTTIVSLTTKRRAMFVPYLKSFFVRSSEPTHVKLLKLEILTNLASETSISSILREFQTYISSTDKSFVAATVQAIGKCAATITQVTDTCLNGLVSLLSNRDEAVVAESVVVIKNLLQTQPQTHTDIIKHMARLADSITVAQARAAILWLLGEYSYLVPKLGPDVLRKMAKTFIDEEDIVKLQVLNLSVKLYLTNPSQSKDLCEYVLTLARYDQNYDIRDRSRLLRQLLFPTENGHSESRFTRKAKQIFLVSKPAPVVKSNFYEEDQFQLGSLSHHIKAKANGYHELPPFASSPPDPNLRTPSSPTMAMNTSNYDEPKVGVAAKEKPHHHSTKTKSFYESDSESSSGPEESDSNEEEGENDEEESGEEDDEEDSSSSEDEDSDSGSDSEEDVKPRKSSSQATTKAKFNSSAVEKKPDEDKEKHIPFSAAGARKSNVDLLLDLEDFSSSIGTPLITPTLGGFLTPSTPGGCAGAGGVPLGLNSNPGIIPIPAIQSPLKYVEVINKISAGRGMVSAQASFTRKSHLVSPQLVSVSLRVQNCHHLPLSKVRIENAHLGYGMSLQPFSEIPSILPNLSTEVIIGVNFNDSTQPIAPKLLWEVAGETEPFSAPLKLNASAGELIKAVSMSAQLFDAEKGKLTGMNEHRGNLAASVQLPINAAFIYEVANLGPIPSDDSILRLAGQSVASGCLILLSINECEVTVNCEKMVLGSMLLNEVLKHLNRKC